MASELKLPHGLVKEGMSTGNASQVKIKKQGSNQNLEARYIGYVVKVIICTVICEGIKPNIEIILQSNVMSGLTEFLARFPRL